MNVHSLPDALRLSVIECKIARIRSDAAEIGSSVGLISELRKLSPVSTPVLDLKLAARDLRLAALKLDQIAKAAGR
jgi:hypothetical protein